MPSTLQSTHPPHPPRRPDWAVRLVIVALMLIGGGCSYTETQFAFHRDLLAADRLADDGHYAEAAEAYEALAFRAIREDLLRYIHFRVALMAERAGDYDIAMERYAELYTRPLGTYDEEAAHALLNTAEIVHEVFEDEAEWLRLLDAVIRTFPNTVYADDALDDMRRHWLDEDPGVFAAYLVEHYEDLRMTEIGDNVAYWAGRVADEQYGDCDAAIELYFVVATRYHRSGLADDSLWRIGECYQRLGRVDEEYALLLGFIDGREVSWVMADYDSEYYGDTLERLAAIHEERQEWAEAIGMWRRYQRTFPLTLRYDDIEYHIMELYSELDDLAAVRKSLQLLETEYPDTRFVRWGRELVAEMESRR